MELFKGNNVPAIYTRILDKILTEGREVGPRGLKTKELSPVCIEVTDPRLRLFGHPHRKDVPIFTYIEGLWMLLGDDKPDMVVHYVPAMANFVNEKTGLFDGAYGPAILGMEHITIHRCKAIRFFLEKNQLEMAYERLKEDPDTRQAIVMINQPYLHKLPTKDYPCTLSFQFLLRNGLLDMIVNMRSQDAWLGLIYDTGEFQWFQEILAGWLGVELGRYIHIDGSLHLYERDWVKAREVVDKDANFSIYDEAIVHTTKEDRMGKEEFDIMLNNLALWEECCRTNNFNKIQKGICFKNSFYKNLVTIITAYNLRLRGFKEASYEMVRFNHSDLGLIYESRWREK